MNKPNLVLIIPLDWFEEHFNRLEAQSSKIQQLVERLEPKQQEEYLSRKETLSLLKCDASTLYLWTKANKIQSFSVGRKLYYKRSQIMSVLEAKEIRRD